MAGRDTLQGTSVGMLVPNMELGRRFRPVGVLLPNLETRRCQTRKLCRRYWACGSAAAKYGNYERACGLGPQEGIPATLAICPSAGRGREAPRVTDVSLADRLPALPTAFPCSRTLFRTRCI